MRFYITANETSKIMKYALMLNNEVVAFFSNKRHATQILNHMKWYEKRFGDFADVADAAFEMHHAIRKASEYEPFKSMRYQTMN